MPFAKYAFFDWEARDMREWALKRGFGVKIFDVDAVFYRGGGGEEIARLHAEEHDTHVNDEGDVVPRVWISLSGNEDPEETFDTVEEALDRLDVRLLQSADSVPEPPSYADDKLRWWCANLQQKQMEPADGGWLLYPEETYGYNGVDSVATGVHMAVPHGHIALVVSRTGQTRIVTPQCREEISVFVGIDGLHVDVSPARMVARVFLLPFAASQAVEADRREEVDP